MKKEKLCIVGLWLIVSYAIALLIYCTFYFVLKKNDAYISAFGSILGATATFFAAFVALYIYGEWKKPHKANFYAEYCKVILESYFRIILLQQKLKIIESQIRDLISYQNTEGLVNPNKISHGKLEYLKRLNRTRKIIPVAFLTTKQREELENLNSKIDEVINEIYLELDVIYKTTSTLAALTGNTSILLADMKLREHMYNLYREIREVSSPRQPYYKYNNLLIMNKDKYLITRQDKFIKEIKEISGLD